MNQDQNNKHTEVISKIISRSWKKNKQLNKGVLPKDITNLQINTLSLPEIQALIVVCRSLKALTIFDSLPSEQVKLILRIKSLQLLVLKTNDYKSFTKQIGKLENLRVLSVQGQNFRDDQISTLVEQLSSLNELKISSTQISVKGIIQLAKLFQLKILRFQFVFFPENAVQAIGKLVTQIKQLYIDYCSMQNTDQLKYISNIKQLSVLNLKVKSIKGTIAMQMMDGLRNLKQLNLLTEFQQKSQLIVVISETCSFLQKLYLNDQFIKEKGIIYLMRLKRLREMGMRANKVSVSILAKILKNIKNIEKISLRTNIYQMFQKLVREVGNKKLMVEY